MNLDRLGELAKKYMKDRKSHRERVTGAIYYHGLRVSRGVIELRKRLTEDGGWDDRLRAAALFHDVGKGFPRHAHIGAALARELLKDEMTARELEDVCGLIAAHQDRRPGSGEYTFWQKLLQDADLLDHYGAQGLWLGCYYSACHDDEMMELVKFYEGEWQKQIAEHRALLNFEPSRQIFDEKAEFEMSVVRRMKLEGKGGYAHG